MIKLLKKILDSIFIKKFDTCYYINTSNNLPQPLDEEEETTWCIIHTDGLHEEVLSLCHIDEDYPLQGDKMSMCHLLFTLLSSGNYGLDDSYFEKE